MIELICGLHNLHTRHYACVATIGNFDGLHKGHQALIHTLRDQAEQLHLPSCVVLFEPHPQEFFLGAEAPARLMRLREKIKILQDLAIDRIVCLRFNKHLANMSPETFVKEVLLDRLGIRLLIVGDDFRFGRGRQGEVTCLEKLGKRYHFLVKAVPSVLVAGKRVDSSRIRAAVKQGDFTLASHLLTRPFVLTGRVIYGDQRGRLLGFPTANIALHRHVTPLNGVFIVRVHGLRKKPLPGVANCGRRPTIGRLTELLEVHVLNFDKIIYGSFLEVEFLKKVRDEKKFASVERLKQQIAVDVRFAKAYFKL